MLQRAVRVFAGQMSRWRRASLTFVAHAGASCVIAAGVWLASVGGAAAQEPLATSPPVFSPVDANGVNLATGAFNLTTMDVSIGEPGAGGLAYVRTYIGPGWRDNYIGAINQDGATYVVSIGGASETFTASGGTFISDQAMGSSLTHAAGIYTYRMSDGSTAVFAAALAGGGMLFDANIARITSFSAPNGDTVTFHYKSVTVQGVSARRLQSVTNNLGYQLHFRYSANAPTLASQLNAWRRMMRVTAINNAVEYCAPTDDICSALSLDWPQSSYTNLTTYEHVSDALGRMTRYYFGPSGVVAIHRPANPTDPIMTIGYGSGRVTSITRGASTWSYAYTQSGGVRTTTVTDPLSKQRVATSSLASSRILSVTDEEGRTTSYAYDSNNRVTRVTWPEGNTNGGYTDYQRDARGNITVATAVPRQGSGLANVVTSASYPATCANPATCNLPESTTDARGLRTDYTYDATHGGALTITAPAPSGSAPVGAGVRPQTRFAYDSFYAYYKNSGGAIVAAASPVYRLVEVSQCATGATCDGAADESLTTIGYGANGVANNRLPVLVTSGAGDGSVLVSQSATYDIIGNLLTVDGPLSGTADTTRYRYDAARQLIGVIGPDPDGGGALLHRAARMTYDADGRQTLIERGTVANQSDGAWAAFSSLEQANTSYDLIGRPILMTLTSGGVTQALAQMNYDSAGRRQCTALRMNPALFASPPSSACTLGAVGPHGPDRITRITYNDAGQPIRATAGYGTPAAADEWTLSYNGRGLAATLADAEGGLTTYEYDGLDRVRRLRFPNPSSAGSSSTDYEEYSYDAASNLTQQRRRDATTIGFGYDNLNRVLLADVSANGDDVSFTYDLLGRTLTQAAAGHTLTFVYDQLSRLTSAQSPLGAVNYQYDAASRRTRMTWPDALYVDYDYDLDDALTAIRENGASSGPGVLAVFTYDNLGRRTGLARGNGVATSYAYDGASRLSTLTNNLASTSHDQTLSFTYNRGGQIVTRANSNTAYQWAPLAPASVNYADNNLNQYTSVGGAGQSYDARANLTSDGTRTFGYDIYNRLISVTGAMALGYDPAGRLYETIAASVTTRFLYDGASVIGEYDAGGMLQRRYVHGPGIDEPLVWYEGAGASDRRWLAADERGSIVAVTNASGAAIGVNTYDEYGVPGSANLGRFQYTGQMRLAEAGLYHYRARAYDPALGRFLQTDPILFDGGINLYAYVANDPINAIDPWGLQGGPRDGPDRQRIEGEIVVPGFWTPPGPAFLSDRPPSNENESNVLVVVASCAQSPACMRNREARQRARDAASWLPGVDLYFCTRENCSTGDWAWAVAGVIPATKFLRLASRVPGCGCFEEGTLVATPDGLRPIEAIAVGDLVLAWDEATGETSPQRVTALIRPEPKVLWRLEVRNADGETAIFHVTDDHPWYVEGAGWIETQNLQAGQRIETADDRGLAILDIAPTDRVERTYNLTVENLHTFLVGEDSAVVHNRLCERILERLRRDFSGRIHGSLPRIRDLGRLSHHQLQIARTELRASIAARRQNILDLGEQGGHGARLSQERRLLEAIDRLLGP